MQDKITIKPSHVIAAGSVLFLTGLTIAAFWIGMRPFDETRPTETTARPAQTSSRPQRAQDSAYQACVKSDGMRESFTTAQIERFCSCGVDKLVEYNGKATDEQQAAITTECLAASGAQVVSRKIKFRAWNENHDHWLESEVLVMALDGKALYDVGWGDLVSIPAITYTLMQYTGLKDKNGVEIYEGDVLRVIDSSTPSEGYVFAVNWLPYGWSLQLSIKDREVIGNIYENPELLTSA